MKEYLFLDIQKESNEELSLGMNRGAFMPKKIKKKTLKWVKKWHFFQKHQDSEQFTKNENLVKIITSLNLNNGYITKN